ncbi:MAG: dUTP diphosphatase [Raoultibacter sp.]|jgi:dUTP pyrophosphatase
MSLPVIPIQLLTDQAKTPSYTRPGDAAVDLCATKHIVLKPFERCLVPTGVCLAIPDGYAGLVLPRSGLAINRGLSLVNSPGLIDSNYRGEVQVIAINLDPKESISINVQDRIAQLVIIRAEEMRFEERCELEETIRGENGFGSSGLQ